MRMQLSPAEPGGTAPAPIECEVLIVGVGIAGCAAALRCAELGLSPLVLCRSRSLDNSASAWAQGGIVFEGVADSSDLLVHDILDAGAHFNSLPAVETLAREGPRRVRHFLLGGDARDATGLDDAGTLAGGRRGDADSTLVAFDRAADGKLHLTEEGAHSLPRIIHVGDTTGRAIQQHLLARVLAHPYIRVLAPATAVDLLTTSHHGRTPADRYDPPTCLGAYILTDDGAVRTIYARETILATGGFGQIFLHTTNPRGARGDGVAMASRAGAMLQNLEFMQFHPTALYLEHGPRHLISEAVRGEGARLVDANGKEFMQKYDERGSLAPRDIVARAIHEEMLARGAPCMYLDCTHMGSDWLRERFPHVHRLCADNDYDMATEPIPIVPAAHYACGGVLVNVDGATSIDRLWAVGEAACTGLHGANRLASTSLLEGLVWGARAAEAIEMRMADAHDYVRSEVPAWQMSHEPVDPALLWQDWLTIRHTMWNYVGLARSAKRLKRARRLLRELENEIEEFYEDAVLSDDLIGLRNGVLTARLVTRAALTNRRSIGCHTRVD
jgi:L-aspartate oxidase